MAESFAARNQIKQQINTRQHLNFVINHWNMMKFAFKDLSRIKYVITAFIAQPESHEIGKLNELKNNVVEMQNSMMKNFDTVNTYVRDVSVIASKIASDFKSHSKLE